MRPVLYNSWEATTFNVNEAGQKALAEKAAKTRRGAVRDGRRLVRQAQRRPRRPGRLDRESAKVPATACKALIDYVNGLGMDFGLWVEPEMVNPDSDLYRAPSRLGDELSRTARAAKLATSWS